MITSLNHFWTWNSFSFVNTPYKSKQGIKLSNYVSQQLVIQFNQIFMFLCSVDRIYLEKIFVYFTDDCLTSITRDLSRHHLESLWLMWKYSNTTNPDMDFVHIMMFLRCYFPIFLFFDRMVRNVWFEAWFD